jgi:aspartyl-tRNA(Asn)/glutamyl-tRNA(Gln) amidotransferase subunit A
VRTLIKADFDEAFKLVDVVGGAIAPTTAFKIGGHGDTRWPCTWRTSSPCRPTWRASVPGLAFPVGFATRKNCGSVCN